MGLGRPWVPVDETVRAAGGPGTLPLCPHRLPSRPVLPRPQIKPGLRQVWRDRTSVQIGLTPDVGVVLAGLEPGEADLLPLLDGTRDADELAALAGARGLRSGRVEALVEVLGQAGVLTGAPTDRAHLHQLRGLDRERLTPDALAWSVVYPDAGDGFGLLAQRARHSTLVVGSGRLALATEAAVTRTGVPVQRCATLPSPASRTAPWSRRSLALLVGEDAVAAPAAADPARCRHPASRGDRRRGPCGRRAPGDTGPVRLLALPRAAPHRPRPALAHRGRPAGRATAVPGRVRSDRAGGPSGRPAGVLLGRPAAYAGQPGRDLDRDRSRTV